MEEKTAFAALLKKRATPAEKVLWKVLKHYEGWSFQEVVYGYIPDFYYKPKKLVVEVDGGVHKRQKKKDDIRTMHLEYRGCKVIRFTNSQVLHNLEGVLIQLSASLEERNICSS